MALEFTLQTQTKYEAELYLNNVTVIGKSGKKYIIDREQTRWDHYPLGNGFPTFPLNLTGVIS